MENLSTLSLLVKRDTQAQPAAQSATKPAEEDKGEGLLGKHKGKLAVGAAAMLGVAIFYKWREHQLEKEDPEEYARLQRLKHAVKNEESPQKKGRE